VLTAWLTPKSGGLRWAGMSSPQWVAIALIAATPILPNVPLGLGLSLDDLLPLLGLAVLAATVPLRALAPLQAHRLLVLGIGTVVLWGIATSLANGDGPVDALRLILRGPGRYVLLAAIAGYVAATAPASVRELVAARALALTGTFEAVFGLIAITLPLPGNIGLEPTRGYSALDGHVPGRVSGTLGISPNFLGAIFVITIPLTAALAISAPNRRVRAAWWVATALQLLALSLTFTRASLGLAIVALVVVVVLRSRPIVLLPLGAIVGLVMVMTPTLERLTGDIPDRLALWTSGLRMLADHPVFGVGPGRMMAVATSDPGRYQVTEFGPAVSNAHNTIILAGAEMGLVALLGVLLLNVGLAAIALRAVISGIRRSASVIRMSAGIAMLGFLVQGMVNNLFTVGATGTVAALTVGAFLLDRAVVGRDAATEPADPGPGPGRQAAPRSSP
jgi:O-antigen ligase